MFDGGLSQTTGDADHDREIRTAENVHGKRHIKAAVGFHRSQVIDYPRVIDVVGFYPDVVPVRVKRYAVLIPAFQIDPDLIARIFPKFAPTSLVSCSHKEYFLSRP